MQNAEGIEAGDVLQFWHDTGAFGAQLCYARVIKVMPTGLLRVRDEAGREALKRPWFFHAKVDAATVVELRADDVAI